MLDSDGLEDGSDPEDIPVMIKKEVFDGNEGGAGPKPIPEINNGE